MATKKIVKKAVLQKRSKSLTTKIAAIGTGVAALGAATYYFFGPKGKEHRKVTTAWMKEMKNDILHRAKKAGNLTEKAYHSLVDEIAKNYAHHGKMQVVLFSKKLKKQWKRVAKPKKIATSVKKKTKK